MKFIATPLQSMSSMAAEAESLGIHVEGADARAQLESLLRAGQLMKAGASFPIAGDQPSAEATESSVVLGRASER